MFFCTVEAHAALPAPFVDAVLQRRKLILDLRVARRSFNFFVRGEIVSEFCDSECLPQDDGVDRLEEYIPQWWPKDCALKYLVGDNVKQIDGNFEALKKGVTIRDTNRSTIFDKIFVRCTPL